MTKKKLPLLLIMMLLILSVFSMYSVYFASKTVSHVLSDYLMDVPNLKKVRIEESITSISDNYILNKYVDSKSAVSTLISPNLITVSSSDPKSYELWLKTINEIISSDKSFSVSEFCIGTGCEKHLIAKIISVKKSLKAD